MHLCLIRLGQGCGQLPHGLQSWSDGRLVLTPFCIMTYGVWVYQSATQWATGRQPDTISPAGAWRYSPHLADQCGE